jgi:hypothetical protein
MIPKIARMESATPRRWISRVGTASVVALLVVLAVLWGVSCFGAVWITDKLPGPYDFSLQPFHGSLGISLVRTNAAWSAEISTMVSAIGTDEGSIRHPLFYVGYEIRPHEIWVRFPFWIPTSLCLLALWYPCRSIRFSLRTFLICAIFVAVIAASIMALVRALPDNSESLFF